MPNLPKRFDPKADHTGVKRIRKQGGRTRSADYRRKMKLYNSKVWRTTRRRVLAGEPLCRACKAEGKTTPAKHVDHIDGDCFNNPADGSNYQPLCISCHAKKTRQHDGWNGEGQGNP